MKISEHTDSMTAPDNSFDAWLDRALAPLFVKVSQDTLKAVGVQNATPATVQPYIAEAKAAIKAKCQEREADSLLKKAIDLSGNEFAMGYNDSGCFWRFYAGARGAGSMMGEAIFHSESPEPLEALTEYIAALTNKTAPTNQKAGEI